MTPMKLRWRLPKFSLAELTQPCTRRLQSIPSCCLIVCCVNTIQYVRLFFRRFKSSYFILIVLILSRGVQRYTGCRYRNQW
jgi:hypothetical protein